MKKYLSLFLPWIIGFLTGLIVLGIIMFKSAPKLMLIENESSYGFEETVSLIEQSAIEKGWKIVVVHDLQKSLAKHDYIVRPVVVFELCHPDHSSKILELNDERIVSSMMPCRVSVYEKDDGKVYISRMNTGLMAKTMGGVPNEVMSVASKDIEEILEVIFE